MVEVRQKGASDGANANAVYRIWGSSYTNVRGESILEFLMEFKLSALNLQN